MSIPIADLVTMAERASGVTGTPTYNLAKVAAPFTVADRYGKTGTTGKPTTQVMIDKIYWTRD